MKIIDIHIKTGLTKNNYFNAELAYCHLLLHYISIVSLAYCSGACPLYCHRLLHYISTVNLAHCSGACPWFKVYKWIWRAFDCLKITGQSIPLIICLTQSNHVFNSKEKQLCRKSSLDKGVQAINIFSLWMLFSIHQVGLFS